jgi:hypothetical protein
MKRPLFPGLVFDEQDNPADVIYIGDEPCYVVDDDGFLRHIPSEQVDHQVLDAMAEQIEGHEDILTDQAAKMLGQEDIFSRAMLLNQFKNIGAQLDQLFETGIPQDALAYLGMLGFKIVINVHGEVVDLNQPGMIAPDDE